MSTPVSLQLYTWDRCFLLLAHSLVLPPLPKPRRRPSATLLISRNKPFAMAGIGAPGQRYQGVLLAPNVARSSLEAPDSDLLILDVGIATPAYQRLRGALKPAGVRVLTPEECASLHAVMPKADQPMNCMQAGTAFEALLSTLGASALAPEPPYDPRIAKVLHLIMQNALDELSLPGLAGEVELSPSRLRALFQQQLGCAPMPYIRWAKTWQAIRIWRKGMSFTEAAHQAGFYDLAHIDHALKELFGMNPSSMATANGVHFLHCGL